MKETLQSVVSEKHEFEKRDEIVIKTFLEFLDDHYSNTGTELLVFYTISSRSRNCSIATLLAEFKPIVLKKIEIELINLSKLLAFWLSPTIKVITDGKKSLLLLRTLLLKTKTFTFNSWNRNQVSG